MLGFFEKFSLQGTNIPHNSMRAHNEFWFRVPLVVRYVETCLKPDPLLSFGQKSVVARCKLSLLHY